MRLRPASLRDRLLATAALFIVLALVATGVAVQVALHRFVQGQIDQRLDGQLRTMASALELDANGAVTLGHAVDGPPFDDPRTGWFWLVRTPTHVWTAAGLRSARLDLPPVPPPPFAHPETLEGHGPDGRAIRVRADHARVGGQDVEVLAAAPLEALNGPLRDALMPLFTALLVLGAGLVAATVLQVRLGLRPLVRLREDLESVRTARAERLDADQPAEVRPLVMEINSLLDQHAAHLERARRHVANLAHALKTPLAGMTLALQEADVDPDGRLKSLAVAMERRIRHHLARARIAALGPSARSRVTLAPRIADHLAAFGRIYADKGVGCSLSVPPELAAACDAQDFDEMVGNLLDNAFKWTRSRVWVEARSAGDQVLLTVADDGPGVSPDRRDTILQPGQRLDESVPGDGFGLSIVQEVVELYGGSVALTERSPNGLTVVLTLPLSG